MRVGCYCSVLHILLMYNSITRARYNLVWPFLRHCAFSLSLSLCPFCFVLLYSLRLHVGTSLTLFCLCFSIFLSLYLSFPAYPYLAHLISQSALSANVYRPVIGTKGKIKADGASNVPTYSIYVHTYIRCIHLYFIHTHTHTHTSSSTTTAQKLSHIHTDTSFMLLVYLMVDRWITGQSIVHQLPQPLVELGFQ